MVQESESPLAAKDREWGVGSEYMVPTIRPKGYIGEKNAVWLAAVIDCEGTICLSKIKARSPRGYCIVPSVQLTNTNPELITRVTYFLRTLGVKDAAHVGKKEFNNPKWKTAYYIVMQRYHDILLLLEYLLPFLIAKRKQAELVIEYCKTRIYPDHLVHLQEGRTWRGRFGPSYDGSEIWFYEQVRILNRKGKANQGREVIGDDAERSVQGSVS